MQMFDTLMLRLTTNVTVSPASSARSSSAAWRMSSMTSGRVSANIAVSSSGRQRTAVAGASDRAGHELAVDRPVLAPPGAAPRDERPELRLDDVEHALLDPLRVHVLRVDAEALGQRVALRLQLLAHLVDRRERVLGRDVVAVRRQPAEVGGALLDQRQPPVGEVRRDLHADVGHQPLRLAHEEAQIVERDVVAPRRHRNGVAVRLRPLRAVGDLGRLGAVVALVRDEVLEDDLLQVAVLGVHLGERLERGDALLDRLADPDQDPAGERDLQLAGGADEVEPHVRVLRRRPLVDDEVRVDRLQHQPLRRRDLAQPGQVARATRRRCSCAAACRARARARTPRRRTR